MRWLLNYLACSNSNPEILSWLALQQVFFYKSFIIHLRTKSLHLLWSHLVYKGVRIRHWTLSLILVIIFIMRQPSCRSRKSSARWQSWMFGDRPPSLQVIHFTFVDHCDEWWLWLVIGVIWISVKLVKITLLSSPGSQLAPQAVHWSRFLFIAFTTISTLSYIYSFSVQLFFHHGRSVKKVGVRRIITSCLTIQRCRWRIWPASDAGGEGGEKGCHRPRCQRRSCYLAGLSLWL